MSEMIEVVIDSVRVSLMSPQRVVILREKEGGRYLPVWVGPYEAEAITVALQEVEISRPMTHDLLKILFATFNAQVLRVEIVALKEDIFYGNIVAESRGRTFNIDARPSDSIALAVRTHAPILVSQAVMDEAGVMPESDMQEETQPSPEEKIKPVPPPTKESEGRLLVFEDFLKKLEENNDEDEKDDEDGESGEDQPKNP